MIKLAFAAASALTLTACAAYPATMTPPATASCPISGSSDWNAWVNAMPGPTGPSLIVVGKVATPTGGYSVGFEPTLIRRESYPVQIVATLRVVPPTGAATQAVVTHDVRGQWPSAEPVGSVDIVCGNQVLARISPVQTAH